MLSLRLDATSANSERLIKLNAAPAGNVAGAENACEYIGYS
jgi:hypothetical protein